MKRLILTQQQLADAYAVPVKSSIYQYFLGLSDRKEKMIGLIIGEYEFFDDGDIEYKEHDFKEIIVSEETMKAWKLSRKASGQTPLNFLFQTGIFPVFFCQNKPCLLEKFG